MKSARLLRTRTAVLRSLAMLAMAGALSVTGLAGANAATSPSTGTSTSSAAPTATTAAKPTPVASTPENTTPVPKPHNSTRVVHPMIPWTVSLTASPATLYYTENSLLTATANADVGPTPYYIYIYDVSTATIVDVCSSGSSCSIAVSDADVAPNSFILDADFIAYIAASGGYPPVDEQAQSGNVYVNWWQYVGPVTLTASANTLPVGFATTLTATTAVDIGPSPFYDQIWDTSTPTPTLLVTCGSGTTCSTTVAQSTAGTHTYVATIADYSTAYPPANAQSTSAITYVTWNNAGWTITLTGGSATSGAYTATANGDVGPTPYYISIDDQQTGTVLASCGSGSTCTAYLSSYGAPLVAFISTYSTTVPPTGITASSNTVIADYEPIG
jgi:hypothetical protein